MSSAVRSPLAVQAEAALILRRRRAARRRARLSPSDWGERHFVVEDPLDENGQMSASPGPIRLLPYQKRILEAALERDGQGRFRWSTVVWSAPKKSGKTRLAAMVAAWVADTHGPYAEVYLCANDGKQSEDRVLAAIQKAVDLGSLPWKVTQSAAKLPDGTFVKALPVDPTGEAGGNPTLVVFSEMWGYRLSHKERMFTEMTVSPARRGRSIQWVESYAGYTGESPVLENLYKLGVDSEESADGQGKRHPDFPDLPVYVNENARLFCYWDHEPRMPWQTPAYYRQQAAVLSGAEFRRIHKNEWVTAETQFIPEAWWLACQEVLPPLDRRTPLVLGADAAVSGDTFALIGVSRHPDPARRKTDVAVRYCQVWEPPRGGEIDYGPIEQETERLCREYNVVEVAYDPYQLHRTATDMRRRRVANWKDFGQTQPRLVADSQLYQLIRDRRIAHSGDPKLKEHIMNANAKLDKDEEHKLRIVKGRGPVDACVALSMAADRCLYLNL